MVERSRAMWAKGHRTAVGTVEEEKGGFQRENPEFFGIASAPVTNLCTTSGPGPLSVRTATAGGGAGSVGRRPFPPLRDNRSLFVLTGSANIRTSC